jgi:predicted methyltransferase
MKTLFCGAALAGVMAAGWAAASLAETPGYIVAAVADPARPDADKARDALRKPGEMMAFAGIHPGETVVELIPGRAYYFTKILSKIVGPGGHVYAASPGPMNAPADAKPAADPLAGNPAYANVSDVVLPGGLPGVAPVDVVWTSQNYHDFHLARLKVDVPATDRLIFSILKPGGEFIVIDHAAVAGSGLEVPDKLHRINEDIVKQEVEAAGFVLEAESDVLRNPADPRTALVFDPSIRGHTDQFVLRFRKPN